MSRIRVGVVAVLCSVALLAVGPARADDRPQPGSVAYAERDLGNIADAYGRVTGPGGQLANPSYFPALVRQSTLLTATQLLTQAADPTRPALNPGGAADALDWFLSPSNPYAALLDRSPDTATVTPGRTTRIAIIGHSMGAFAVSKIQATDTRVETIVALDKLAGAHAPTLPGTGGTADNTPVVPALAIQSEYGFTVAPYFLSGGSSLAPTPGNPDPMRERSTGYDDWVAAGKDAMLVVPRASTHLEYTDIPYVLPASRWGQATTSVYVQAWLDRYLKHRGDDGALLGTALHYLEPRGKGLWAPLTIDRESALSFYYCSAYALHAGADGRGPLLTDGDVDGVGGCTG